MTDALTQALSPSVDLTIADKTYSLALNTAAILSLHALTGFNIFSVTQWSRIASDPSVLISTLWAALQVNNAAEFKTVKDAETLVTPMTFIAIDKALGELLMSLIPKKEGQDPNVQAAARQS